MLILTAGDWISQVIAWFDFAADDASAAPTWKRVKQTLPLGAAIIFDGDRAARLGNSVQGRNRANWFPSISPDRTRDRHSLSLLAVCGKLKSNLLGSPQIAASFVTWKKNQLLHVFGHFERTCDDSIHLPWMKNKCSAFSCRPSIDINRAIEALGSNKGSIFQPYALSWRVLS